MADFRALNSGNYTFNAFASHLLLVARGNGAILGHVIAF